VGEGEPRHRTSPKGEALQEVVGSNTASLCHINLVSSCIVPTFWQSEPWCTSVQTLGTPEFSLVCLFCCMLYVSLLFLSVLAAGKGPDSKINSCNLNLLKFCT
jgi:hypothetical protein